MQLGGQITNVITILRDYNELIQLSTSLLLAYVTWSYAYASQKTLEFMRYSFEKEYEEDIKFMFVNIEDEELHDSQKDLEKEIKFFENQEVINGRDKIPERLILEFDNTCISLRIFNSGRRLASHLKLEYRVEIRDLDHSLYNSWEVKTIIPKTLQPNDYITFPLVKVEGAPRIGIQILSLKTYNGLGKEQLNNSPKASCWYENKNIRVSD